MPKWRRRSCSRLFRPCSLPESVSAQLLQPAAGLCPGEDASTGEALAKKYAKGIEVKPRDCHPFTNLGRYGALNFYGNECKGKRLRLSLVPGKTALMTEPISRSLP